MIRTAASPPERPLRELTRPVRGSIRLGVAIQALGAVAEIVPFIAIGELARRLLDGRDDAEALRPVILLVVAALGLRALCGGAAIMITHFADARLGAILRRSITSRLGRLPLGWFSRHSSGTVKKAVDDDVAALHQLVAHHAVETTSGVAVPIVGIAYLITLDWRLALAALLPLVLYLIAFAIMMRDSTERMAQMDAGTARVNAAIVEFVRGIAVVKTFGRTGRAHEAYRRATHDFATSFADWVRPLLRLEAISSIVLAPATVLTTNLALGLWFVSAGWVTPVDAVIASMVALVVPAGFQVLVQGMQARMQSHAAAARLHELLQTPTLPVAAQPAADAPSDAPAAELDGVTFAYEDGVTALEDVSLRLEPGTVTALVGPSGAGKSTIASLVLRFHDVDRGVVRVGGHDVRTLAPSELYRRVGFVLQDVQLLRASVADNISLGRPDADRDTVIRVARAAQVHDRILDLPRGYDSVVGEDALLSGGEAQRVSIARAMLHDPDLLVLDEATAFADPDTEAAVQTALSQLVAGRTLLVVAHRLSTITGADQVVVIEGGRIVERGRHRELVVAGGCYARLWADAARSRGTEEVPA